MSLSSLPNEIISNIITHIPSFSDAGDNYFSIRALWALSTCSRRLHELVEPILYSSFTELTETSLLGFLRTILESPHLARLVKTYEGIDSRSFVGEASLVFPFTGRTSQQEKDEIHYMLLRAIQRGDINDDGSSLWLEDILHGSWDAATALAITCLPNLKELNLKILNVFSRAPGDSRVLEYDDPFDPMAFRWINGVFRDAQELQSREGAVSERAMRNLDTIKLALLDNTITRVYVSNILGFLRLRSLKTFQANSLWLVQDVDSMSFSVPNISLDNCVVRIGYPAWVLRLFTQVERLEFTTIQGLTFSANELVSALSHLNKTLRELIIRGCESGGMSPSVRYRPSLIAFDVLEKLDIMAPHLIGWLESSPNPADPPRRISWESALPNNIKTLSVRRCVQSTVVNASTLVGRKKEGLCKLRVLHLEFMWDFPQEAALRDVNLLRDDCVAAGVTFTVDWDGRWLV